MTGLKQWVGLTAVAVLAVIAAGWFLLVSPKRAEAADLRQQATDQQHTTSTLRSKLAVLKEQAKVLPEKQAELATITAKLPADTAQPALLRALAAAADGAAVELISVAPSALVPVTSAPVATTTATGTSTAATTASGTAATTGSAAASSGTLMAMPLSINVFGGYFEMEQYMAALEDLPRALRVTGLTVTPGANPVQTGATPTSVTDDGQHLLGTITADVFVAVGADPATPVVAPVASTGK